VKVVVDGELLMSVAEGNGPVNALDGALRKDLGKYSSYLADLRLTDYKVRILAAGDGTAATTRVMIEHADGAGNRWTTVGVSPNIVDASFQALYDGIVYKLLRDRAPSSRVSVV
jgi:2-isopropylmalate synthase